MPKTPCQAVTDWLLQDAHSIVQNDLLHCKPSSPRYQQLANWIDRYQMWDNVYSGAPHDCLSESMVDPGWTEEEVQPDGSVITYGMLQCDNDLLAEQNQVLKDGLAELTAELKTITDSIHDINDQLAKAAAESRKAMRKPEVWENKTPQLGGRP